MTQCWVETLELPGLWAGKGMVPLGVPDIDLALRRSQSQLSLEPWAFPGKGIYFPGTLSKEQGLLYLPEWTGSTSADADPGGGGGGPADVCGGSFLPPCSLLAFPSGQVTPAPARPADGPPARGVSAGPPLGTQGLG